MKHSDKIKLTNQIADAIQRGNDTFGYISDEGTLKFRLPSPQTTGSMTQQRAYAVSCAIGMMSRWRKYLVD